MAKQVVEELIIKIAADSKELRKEYKGVKKANMTLEDSFKGMAKIGTAAFLSIGGAATALGKKATEAFVDFEKGATNVAKTTNLMGQEFEDFKDEIIRMSEEMPVTTDRLLEIATAAGQLGIKGTPNLVKFTEVIAKLGATTNIEGEAAALGIARILNITGEAIDTVDKFGATIVDLGNNIATSESEILEMATEVAKATVQFNLSSEQILGMSAAMSALGMQAEAGSTVVGKAFQAISDAVSDQAGPAFEMLMDLTGRTGEEITDIFLEDSSRAFQEFILGLSKAAKQGEITTKQLEDFGLKGIRINKILPTLAERSDKLSDAMIRAGESSKNASALNEEFARVTETNASKLQIAQTKINNLFIKIGETITPKVVGALEEIVTTIENSGPAIEGLAKSFAWSVDVGAGFVTTLQSMARELRILASLDLDLIMLQRDSIRQEAHLMQMLRDRNMTLEEFKQKQKELAKLREEAAAKAEAEAAKEAQRERERKDGIMDRVKAFSKGTFAIEEATEKTEEKKVNTVSRAEKRKEKIRESAAKKELDQLKKAEAKRRKEEKKANDQREKELIDSREERLKIEHDEFIEIQNIEEEKRKEQEERQLELLDSEQQFTEEFKGITKEGYDSLTAEQKEFYANELMEAEKQRKSVGDVQSEAYLERRREQIAENNRTLQEEERHGPKHANL